MGEPTVQESGHRNDSKPVVYPTSNFIHNSIFQRVQVISLENDSLSTTESYQFSTPQLEKTKRDDIEKEVRIV
jgi:hypothetical protein